jgi:hypothetical protein
MSYLHPAEIFFFFVAEFTFAVIVSGFYVIFRKAAPLSEGIKNCSLVSSFHPKINRLRLCAKHCWRCWGRRVKNSNLQCLSRVLLLRSFLQYFPKVLHDLTFALKSCFHGELNLV